jgi:hypothetical protein
MDETISLLRLAQDAVAAMAPGTYTTLEQQNVAVYDNNE